ncbi:DUF3515 domain-containing protein [Micromonospora zamorensis]|uniref:DUF3515 domain-containing protein n=2 Tax=Micromonosporaceae TaxID=28056 RepID=A0ABZ1P958_9ACTN|nr:MULTISPECIES: DUF3515 domain-containing protein [Micromonospora]WSK46990.1 DUF3515 domain-containing protein [Micromonospora zamorensis]
MDEMTASSARDDDRTREPADGNRDPADTAAAAPAGRDRTIRGAALLATVIALPITLLVAVLAFNKLSPGAPAAAPTPSATTPRVQSTAPVEMAAPALAARPATVCRALLSQLPANIRDLTQRPVTAGPEQNAAYGDPALTVACGGTEPEFPSTDEVWTVNRVCWHLAEQADAAVLSTVDRETLITVRVPRSYEQPLQWLTTISSTIVATVPSGGAIPSGCQR